MSFAVLVLSCDRYSDMWPVFLRQFRCYFPPRRYKVYIGSNTVSSTDPDVVTVLSGGDSDWSTSVRNILRQIPEQKLLVILEDLLLSSAVDEDALDACLACLFDVDALHIKYWGKPWPEESSKWPLIGCYPRGIPYRATVCGFWDREFLLSLLIEGESPWEFEINGSYRASFKDGIYGLRRPLCEYRNMIEKGCWIPQSVDWARSANIQLSLERRPMLRGGNQVASRLKMAYFDLVMRVPWRWRVALMGKLRRLLISY